MTVEYAARDSFDKTPSRGERYSSFRADRNEVLTATAPPRPASFALERDAVQDRFSMTVGRDPFDSTADRFGYPVHNRYNSEVRPPVSTTFANKSAPLRVSSPPATQKVTEYRGHATEESRFDLKFASTT